MTYALKLLQEWTLNIKVTNPCITCRVREGNFCAALMGESPQLSEMHRDFHWQVHESASPGKIISARGEPCADVFVVCEGWAFRLIRLSDGRRQILSTLLPGDFFSSSMLFEEHFQFSVQALTAVRYSRMKHDQVKAQAATNPKIWDAVARTRAAERKEADELATDLGRRSADERIAHLMLSIIEKLRKREVIQDQHYTFPLRQQHIADMTGLTPVHVSRVMTTFRKANLVSLSGGFLKVLNQPELERLGRLK